jgi:TonB family protein
MTFFMRQILMAGALLLPGMAAAGPGPAGAVPGLTAPIRSWQAGDWGGPMSPVGPRAESAVLPEYPPAARRARFDGRVLLAATIDLEGRVVDLRPLEEIDDATGFTASAMRAIAQWTYKPAVDAHGRPVPVPVVFDVRFTP